MATIQLGPATWRKLAALGIRVVVVGLAVWFLARGISWSDVTASLRAARPPLLVAVVVLYLVMMAIRAARLRAYLTPSEVPYRSCFEILLASTALNNVTPLRGGDVARLWMLERAAGFTKAAGVSLTLTEKAVELGVLGALAGAVALVTHGQVWAQIAGPIVAAGAIVGLVVMHHVLARARTATGPWLRRLAPLATGAKVLGRPDVLVRVVVLSALAWTVETAMIIVCGWAVGLPIGPALAVTVLFGMNLAIVLPSAPAGIGPLESAVVVTLGLAGIVKGTALGFALLYHAVLAVPVTVVGLAAIARRGIGVVAPPPVEMTDRAA